MFNLLIIAFVAFVLWDKIIKPKQQSQQSKLLKIDCVDCKSWNHRDALPKCEKLCSTHSGKYTNNWTKKDDTTITCDCSMEDFTL
jgi:hypothetical protein